MNSLGITLQQTASNQNSATFCVAIDGKDLGSVTFVKGYEPALEEIGRYVALFAGETLCVITPQHGVLRCIDRGDETHRIHAFETSWIVEGELQVDLFDPASATILATYNHSEVITSCKVTGGLVRIVDFAGTTFSLDPRRSLEVVRSQESTSQV